jgi:two-component system cell cycle sensor histidine kinase/response regulator CckA
LEKDVRAKKKTPGTAGGRKAVSGATGKLKAQIAELEKSRTALQESEERHRVISELTTDYMCIIGVNSEGKPKMTWAADSMKKITGRGVDDATTLEQWQGSIHPDDRPIFMEFVRRTFAGGGVGELDCRSVSKDGHGRWVRILVKPQLSADGRIRSIYVGVKDISERKEAQELLRRSAAAWATTFDAIADPILILDTEQRIMRCNAAFIRFAGVAGEEIEGRTCHSVIHGMESPIDGCPYLKMIKSGRRESMELEIRDRVFEVLTDPIVDESGARSGSAHIMTDITDRKRLEREKALMEEELRQAAKMEAIGRLAGGVAHDFNNMLAAIMGNAEALQSRLADDPAAREHAANIIFASEHVADLTSQLLAFARKGTYRRIALDLHGLITGAVGILEKTIDKRIEIRREFRADPSTVLGDPSQLESAFMNLSLNARDAMPDGGRLLFSTDTVEFDRRQLGDTQLKMEPGGYVRVSIADTGIGMPAEVKERIFEPFFTTKALGKGTGLGLAGVYGTVMNHGGSIQFSSDLGRGSTFVVFLPLIEVKGLEHGTQREDEARIGTGTVLIVDDERPILDITGQMLRKRGFTVHVCASPIEALEFYRGRYAEIDLVILDMRMPEMEGRTVFHEMKKINPDARVLVSSGYSLDGEAEDMLREGAAGFVQKPFRIAQLIKMILDALGR